MVNRQTNYHLNWRPDKPDWRDKRVSLMVSVPELPRTADLRPQCPPIVDQGSIGSCTANALAGALGFIELKELADGFQSESMEFKDRFEPLSRLFIYYNERDMEGDVNQDGGAEIRDGIKTLAKIGACSEEVWPYQADMLFIRPSPSTYAQALSHQITSYVRLQSLDHVRASLAGGSPVAFGFTCYESLEDEIVSETGILPMPGPDEAMIGGHAVLAVGYDDDTERLLVRNSWGTGWGLKGYFWMPYDYFRALTSDYWRIQK